MYIGFFFVLLSFGAPHIFLHMYSTVLFFMGDINIFFMGEKLTSIQFCFPRVDCLEVFVMTSPIWKKGSCLKFQFAVGDHDSTPFQILESFDYPSLSFLTLVNSEGVNPVILKVLMETHAFGLINHKGASRLSDFGIENTDNMPVCLIKG